MNPLVTLLLRSIAGKAFQKAPEGSALNFMGTQMERYDPISGIIDLARICSSDRTKKYKVYKNTVMPECLMVHLKNNTGPVGAIENRISSIMNRTAPQTPLSRNLILDLYNARDELVGGQGINAVTRPGTYGYDDVM
jgi:hypothetical protein